MKTSKFHFCPGCLLSAKPASTSPHQGLLLMTECICKRIWVEPLCRGWEMWRFQHWWGITRGQSRHKGCQQPSRQLQGQARAPRAAILLFTPLTLETRMQRRLLLKIWHRKPEWIYISQGINESKLTFKPSLMLKLSLWFSKASFIPTRLKNWHKEANVQDGT